MRAANANAVVIGQGSIGARHYAVLDAAGASVQRISRRMESSDVTLDEAVDRDPECYVVVAAETNRHVELLGDLERLGHRGPVLCEKPIAVTSAECAELASPNRCFVGYNLRFHPLIARAKAWIDEGGPVVMDVRAGQDLRAWRPGREIATSASAESVGGGVLRDFSHELDYLLWWFGPWASVIAQHQRLADLPGIEADAWSAIIEFTDGSRVNLSLNYLDTPAQRSIVGARPGDTLRVDLIRSEWIDAGGVEQVAPPERNATYHDLHRAILNEPADPRLCSLPHAIEVLRLVEALERSALERKWITP